LQSGVAFFKLIAFSNFNDSKDSTMFLGTPWEGVTAGAMLGAGLILAIGAQNAFVLRQGLRREHVLLVVLTCLMGDIICISAGVAGVGGFIVSHPSFLAIATWGGALFLLYYGGLAAWRAIRARGRLLVETTGEKTPAMSVFLTALAFTFLNPHVYLDTVVLLGSLSTQYGDERWWFSLGAMLESVVWFFALGFGAQLLTPIFRRASAWRIFDAIVAVLLWILAASLILNSEI